MKTSWQSDEKSLVLVLVIGKIEDEDEKEEEDDLVAAKPRWLYRGL